MSEFAEPFFDGLGWPSVASPLGGDTEAREWWQRHRNEVGLGDTPDAALEDLKAKIARGGRPEVAISRELDHIHQRGFPLGDVDHGPHDEMNPETIF